jgi:CBS domain containing-hemolysin-like protein
MTFIISLSVFIIAISFLCSLLEAVILSVTPAYVAVAVKNKERSGLLLQRLKENIDRPISAILTLNTISHTLGSAAVGALVQQKYGDEYLTIVSILLTLAILILSEIFPKVIGAAHWKALAPFAAYTIQAMIFLLYPFVRTSEALSSIFAKPQEQSFTREEMIETAELGATEGTLHKKETVIIKNLLMLDNIYVSDIMTPRSVMFAIDSNCTVEEIAKKNEPIRFSRIPVFEGSVDNIIGMTHRYKILESLSNDQHNTKVKDLVRPINTVQERMSVAAVIDWFVKHKEHLALAVDEYGVITGLVSLEDAVETLLGVEIVDEFDKVADLRQYALEQWQIRKNQFRKS